LSERAAHIAVVAIVFLFLGGIVIFC